MVMKTSLFDHIRHLFARPEREPEVSLAVFGKHRRLGPEHILRGIGAGSEACADVRYTLYERGITNLLPHWNQTLAPEQRLPEFNHTILWVDRTTTTIVRLVASPDAVGRNDYPFMVVARFLNLPLPIAAEFGAAAVNEIVTAVDGVSGLHEMLITVHEVESGLRRRAAEAMAPDPDQARRDPPSGPRTRDLFIPPSGLDGLRRHLERLSPEDDAPITVRYAPARPADAKLLVDALSLAIPASLRMRAHLAITPHDADWIDLILGEPNEAALACLLETPKARAIDVREDPADAATTPNGDDDGDGD